MSELKAKIDSEPNSVFDSPSMHLLGDSAYALHDHVLVPYKDFGTLTSKQLNYNYRHSRTRMPIENTFGQLKCRFRRLKMIDCSIKLVPTIIVVSCVLHNICLLHSDTVVELAEECETEVADNCSTRVAANIGHASVKRDKIADLLYKK